MLRPLLPAFELPSKPVPSLDLGLTPVLSPHMAMAPLLLHESKLPGKSALNHGMGVQSEVGGRSCSAGEPMVLLSLLRYDLLACTNFSTDCLLHSLSSLNVFGIIAIPQPS